MVNQKKRQASPCRFIPAVSHEASLSLKFGEMLSLMVAIVLGIVIPLKPTVQLLNLFLTHVLCTWSFAFEEAEDYIMTIPPRNVKKDLDGGYPLVMTNSLLLNMAIEIVSFPIKYGNFP